MWKIIIILTNIICVLVSILIKANHNQYAIACNVSISLQIFSIVIHMIWARSRKQDALLFQIVVNSIMFISAVGIICDSFSSSFFIFFDLLHWVVLMVIVRKPKSYLLLLPLSILGWIILFLNFSFITLAYMVLFLIFGAVLFMIGNEINVRFLMHRSSMRNHISAGIHNARFAQLKGDEKYMSNVEECLKRIDEEIKNKYGIL